MVQYFKGDEIELKFDAAGEPILTATDLQRDAFEENAYDTVPLGALIWDDKRSPLSYAIKREIFIHSFKELFDAFVKVGTFEAYISVFQKIFGEEATVQFTVPAPGKLVIEIEADGVELSNFIARHIVDNEYLIDEMITDDDDGDDGGGDDVDALDEIVFQTIKGFTSQYELEQMLFEMVPAGIFTEINLTLG